MCCCGTSFAIAIAQAQHAATEAHDLDQGPAGLAPVDENEEVLGSVWRQLADWLRLAWVRNNDARS